MSTRDKLLIDVESFLALHDMRDTKLGILALNDPAFVSRLRNPDKKLWSDTIDRVYAFMASHEKALGRVSTANQSSRRDRPRARARA